MHCQAVPHVAATQYKERIMLRVILSVIALSAFALAITGCRAEGQVQTTHAAVLPAQ